jgi:hypothetical protein
MRTAAPGKAVTDELGRERWLDQLSAENLFDANANLYQKLELAVSE